MRCSQLGRMVSAAERVRLARQNDEHGLGDLLRQQRVAHLPHRRRIDEVDVARDQRGKRRLGLAGGVVPQQCHVVIHCSPIHGRPRRKGTVFFYNLENYFRRLRAGGG